MKCSEVIEVLGRLAPESCACDWDNPGLLAGRSDKEVKKIYIALDATDQVVEAAIKGGADMLLTHHPLIFHPLYSLTDDTAIGRTAATLLRHDIAAFSAHTNLDIAPQGVGACLAAALGLEDISVIEPIEKTADGVWGLLRMGTVAPQPLETFLLHVKQQLHTPAVRYAPASEKVHRVAVGGGACADEWKSAFAAGCDAFVTADAKYNDFWDARDAGLTLIDAGHFYTENPVCTYLQQILQEAFPEIRVVLSQVHQDCMKFY